MNNECPCLYQIETKKIFCNLDRKGCDAIFRKYNYKNCEKYQNNLLYIKDCIEANNGSIL